MYIRSLLVGLALSVTCTACDGPKEKAGAAKDKAAARASGVPYEGGGPAERAGAAADRVDRADAKARASRAEALKDEGRAIQAQADAQADKLEREAEALRSAAKDKAGELDQQAQALTSQP